MPVMRLGKRNIAAIPPVERLTIFYDDQLKGFGLRVMPSGTRSWIVEYRPGAGGRHVAKKRMAFGTPAALTPDKARDEAKRLLASVELGGDPAAERSKARAAETVGDLLDAYMEERIAPKRKPTTARLFEGYIAKHIRPAIGSHKANTLRRSDVASLHQSIGRRHPVTANRLLTLLSAAYTYGAKAGIVSTDVENPAKGVDKFPEKPRERYLTVEELGRLGDTLMTLPPEMPSL